MSELTKGQLRSDNNSSFPNNNAQAITPTILRDYNGNIIDSLVDEITYQADSGSWNAQIAAISAGDTGSLLVTASVVDATTTYTKGDGSVFTTTINNVVNATSASHAENADVVPYSGITDKPTLVSGSSQVSYPDLSNIPAGIVSGSVITSIVGGTDIGANTVSGVTTINNTMVTGSVARTNENNVFSGNQTFNDITVNGTGSFAYISSVTGSAKTIGDAFIQLNNDTPKLRYAGVKVLDSGSASPTTASIQYDGGTNDWFFEKQVGAAAELGVALAGPEYTIVGTPTYNASNKVLKGTGGHHIVDSNITDDGSLVNITSNTDITGSVGIDGTLGISGISNVSESIASASAAIVDPFPFTGNAEITGSLIVSQSGLSSGDDVFLLGYPRTGGNSLQGVIRSTVDDGMFFYGNKNFSNGSNTFGGGITGFESGPVQMGPAGSPVNLEFQNGSAIVVDPQTSALPISGGLDVSGSLAIRGISDVSASIAAASGGGGGVTSIIAGTNVTISPVGGTGAVTVNSTGGGSVPAGTVSGSSQIDYPLISNIPAGIISGSEQLPAGVVSGSSQIDITATTNYGNVATQAGNNTFSGDNEFGTSGTTQNFNGTNNIPTIAGDVIVSDGGNGSTITVQGTSSGGNRATRMDTVNVTATFNGTDKAYLGGAFGSYFSVVNSLTNDEIGFVLKSQTYSGTGWTGPGISSNANNGYETVMGWQDQATYTDNRTTFRTPAEFQDLVEIKKAVITNVTSVTPDGVNNIEIDFATTGIQEVTLGNGVTNSFTTNNVTAGQTINLKITQNATAASSVSFSSDFKQPDGSAYVPTADLGAVDILTLMTFTSTSDVYIVAVNKFV